MNDDVNEEMLDLLCRKAVYGLNEEETMRLERLEVVGDDLRTLELTAAVIGMINLKTDEALPLHLQEKIEVAADGYFASQTKSGRISEAAAKEPTSEISFIPAKTRSFSWNWLGWAFAAAASVALAVNIWLTRTQPDSTIADNPRPAPIQEEILTPSQQRQRLLESPVQVLTAQLGKGNVKEIDNVSGDVVWSDVRQAGYVRVQGLPKNDANKETYQLWIFDESQDPKTPIDGGTFNIEADGEVVIPIDARLRAVNPKAFAVTIEKPGGVVVSKQAKVAALAKRET